MELANTKIPLPPPSARFTPASLPHNISHHSIPSTRDAQLAALRVLAVSLLRQIQTLEDKLDGDLAELNLHDQVQRFEAELIKSALEKTGGRQRRAARLLGVKVTTLNTKIKRLQIKLD